MHQDDLSSIEEMEIEPLSDEALETVAGGGSSDGPSCCSCSSCSGGGGGGTPFVENP